MNGGLSRGKDLGRDVEDALLKLCGQVAICGSKPLKLDHLKRSSARVSLCELKKQRQLREHPMGMKWLSSRAAKQQQSSEFVCGRKLSEGMTRNETRKVEGGSECDLVGLIFAVVRERNEEETPAFLPHFTLPPARKLCVSLDLI